MRKGDAGVIPVCAHADAVGRRRFSQLFPQVIESSRALRLHSIKALRTPAVPIVAMLAAGAVSALYLPGGALPWLAAGAVAAWQLALLAFVLSRVCLFAAAALASVALSAAASATDADWHRRHVSLLSVVPSLPSGGEPVVLEGVLTEDAALREGGGASLQLRARRVIAQPGAFDVDGGVALSVAGTPDPSAVGAWRRGRTIRAPVLLRRPARYMNDGIADAERAAMRRGLAVVGTVKSGALVEIAARGSPLDELMARARQRARAAIAAALHRDPLSAGVVTAILIGDRGGLPADIERRMQRAGTYHVIAISGGNIALFALLAWSAYRLLLRSRRLAVCGAMATIAAYGLLVGSGASVGRAVLAALLFFFATLIAHRAPPLNVIAVVGAMFLIWDPLAVVDLGFLLSFGATAGIVLAVPRWIPAVDAHLSPLCSSSLTRRAALSIVAMMAATAAAEIALLPIQAAAFQRVTVAGLALNLVAIPAMAVTQIAGMAILACAALEADALLAVAAAIARLAARALVHSSSLVDIAPWLTWRVATPPDWLLAIYLCACVMLAWRRAPRIAGGVAGVATAAGVAIAMSAADRVPADGRLRLSMFDVGQAEALLLTLPSGRSVLIDAAGPPGRFDIGDRVLVPAIAARGVTRLDAFALTHADLDHVGGAPAVIADLQPSRILEGIAMPRQPERNAVVEAALARGASIESLRAGSGIMLDGVLLDVLHPPPPDWERQSVRNDDSLVIDVRFGAVSILLMGDTGEPVEAAIAGRLTHASLRILKAGHHGSRTSTSQAFIDAVRPDAALISVGRANMYGHPSPTVLARLRRRGMPIFRTDQDGQVDVVTDGRTVQITAHAGRRWAISAR